MAKQKKDDLSAWSRFMLWVKQNEKVLFVLLLAAMGFTFAFGDTIGALLRSGPGGQTIALGYGVEIDSAELKVQEERLNNVLGFAASYFQTDRSPTLASVANFNARDLLIYKKIALKEGLRISDAELESRIKQIWRLRKAAELVAEQNKDNPQANQWTLMGDIEKSFEVLEDKGVWDPQDFGRMVKEDRNTRFMRIATVEETIRDLLLIAQLGHHVTGAIAVKPQDVYEEFRSSREQRKFRWLEAKVGDDVREKIAASVTQADIDAFYDANRSTLTASPRVKFSWLKASREAFEAEVEKGLTDDELKNAYQADRHQYLKPGLYPDAQAFALLSKEEMAARENAMYQPLEEVKDKVRARHIRKTANSRLSTLKYKLRTRLYPQKLKDGTNRVIGTTADSFADVVADTPQCATGTTGWFTQEEAEEVIGDLYVGAVKTEIDSFFTEARSNSTLSEAKLKGLETEKRAANTDDDELYEGLRSIDDFVVFLSDVQLLGRGQGSLDELRDQVVDGIVNERINEAVAKALEAKVEASKSASVDLASLAKTTIEIDVAPVGKVAATFQDVEDLGNVFVARRGSVRVDKPAEKTDDDEEIDPAKIQQETHPSSQALVKAVFAIEKVGQLDIATDDVNGRTYLVEFTQTKNPDPGDFEKSRKFVERDLVTKRRDDAFLDWRKAAFAAAGITLATDQES